MAGAVPRIFVRWTAVIGNLGVSNVSAEQAEAARQIAPIVAVQNHCNIAHRQDDTLVDRRAERGIAFVPFWPLGGFRPFQIQAVEQVAAQLGATARQIALAWLLRSSPTVLLIPGTSTRAHLAENTAAATLDLPHEALRLLNALADTAS